MGASSARGLARIWSGEAVWIQYLSVILVKRPGPSTAQGVSGASVIRMAHNDAFIFVYGRSAIYVVGTDTSRQKYVSKRRGTRSLVSACPRWMAKLRREPANTASASIKDVTGWLESSKNSSRERATVIAYSGIPWKSGIPRDRRRWTGIPQ